MTDIIELSQLPEPALIEELDFDAEIKRRKDRLVELYPPAAEWIDNPGAPGVKQIEAAVYKEMVERNKVNVLYRSNILYFARGTSLDHIADRYGVDRLDGESDEDLIRRIRISNRGSSSAGPDDWWRKHALAAHERVEAVAVYRVPVGTENEQRGLVQLSILSKDPDGVPSQEVLDAVRARVTRRDVRNICATVQVVAATSITVDVEIKVWLRKDAVPGVFESMEQRLRDAVAGSRALGWDLTPSWIVAQLHTAGVYRIEVVTPAEPVSVPFDVAPVLGNVSLTNEGVID